MTTVFDRGRMKDVLRGVQIVLRDQLKQRLATKPDNLDYLGIIRIQELPAMTQQEYREWWPRLTPRERDRYTVKELKNIITINGRSLILTYIGTATSNSIAGFSQVFSVGTFPITGVSPSDTSVNSELARVAPSSFTQTGNTVDISFFFGTATGNGTWTNGGIYGNGASTTLGTGALMTHALLNNFVKSSAISANIEYVISLS